MVRHEVRRGGASPRPPRLDIDLTRADLGQLVDEPRPRRTGPPAERRRPSTRVPFDEGQPRRQPRPRPDAARLARPVGLASSGLVVEPRLTASPLSRPELLSVPMRIRRAFFLVVVSLIAPGSAQLVAGNRRVGRTALKIWLTLIGFALLVGVTWLLNRGIVLWFATSALVLYLLAGLCFVIAIGWPLLVLDAWRLGRPGMLPRDARKAMTGTLVVALLLTTVPVVATGRRLGAGAGLLNGIFGVGQASAASSGRYNVLLLGGDAGADRTGTRPDSITLASVDASTGRTVLFSIPRNLENVKFPSGTPAAKALPKGFDCGDECLINGVYQWGAEHPSAFPGAADPGAEAMKQAVQWVTGLKVNYYVLIDLNGFRDLIDAMGGITVTVRQPVPIGGGSSRVSGYIQPGTQKLDGYHALWYARSRHGANDYARMQRQKCVMDAMLTQLDPATLLARFQKIAGAAQRVMSTDLPASELSTFLDLGTKAKSQKVTSVSFVPPTINPAYPDFDIVRDRVTSAVKASREASARAAARASTPASVTAKPASTTSSSSSSPAVSGSGAADDVSSACSPG